MIEDYTSKKGFNKIRGFTVLEKDHYTAGSDSTCSEQGRHTEQIQQKKGWLGRHSNDPFTRQVSISRKKLEQHCPTLLYITLAAFECIRN